MLHHYQNTKMKKTSGDMERQTKRSNQYDHEPGGGQSEEILQFNNLQ